MRYRLDFCSHPLNLEILHLLGRLVGSGRLGLGLGLLGGRVLGKILGVRKELWGTGNVFAQHLGNFKALFNESAYV